MTFYHVPFDNLLPTKLQQSQPSLKTCSNHGHSKKRAACIYLIHALSVDALQYMLSNPVDIHKKKIYKNDKQTFQNNKHNFKTKKKKIKEKL